MGEFETGTEGTTYSPLDDVPAEPPAWQAMGLLRKEGPTLLITPPGACSFALCAFFSAYLTGRARAPFGMARYPGDVMFSTHTPHLDRSMRAALLSLEASENRIFVRTTQRPFDWSNPTEALNHAPAEGRARPPVAVIIDAGTASSRLSATEVEDAFEALSAASRHPSRSVIVVVEANSRNPDPFERIPKQFKGIRGTLLAAPLRSKALVPDPGSPSEFMLVRLAESTPTALTLRFGLVPALDFVESIDIWWGELCYQDPREAFRRAETTDLSAAQRKAVQLACEIIRERGPTSSRDLQAACKFRHGLAMTTVRDALSVARLLGYLDTARSYDGRWFWIVPGVTKLSFGMIPSSRLKEEDLPF